jgi:hypothetical protein
MGCSPWSIIPRNVGHPTTPCDATRKTPLTRLLRGFKEKEHTYLPTTPFNPGHFATPIHTKIPTGLK